MFDCVPKMHLFSVKKKETNHVRSIYIISNNFICFIGIMEAVHYKVALE